MKKYVNKKFISLQYRMIGNIRNNMIGDIYAKGNN